MEFAWSCIFRKRSINETFKLSLVHAPDIFSTKNVAQNKLNDNYLDKITSEI